MEKKNYVPMTVCHEEFQMNQAIAGGCTYALTNYGVGCDNCSARDGRTRIHFWTVYDNGSYGIGVSETDMSQYIDGRDGVGGCLKLPVRAGEAYIASDGALDGLWDPNGNGEGTSGFKKVDTSSFQYDSSGNIVYNSAS